jgi:hypothetical protein
MDKSFSPVVFIYGMAIIYGVSKACTLLIWRTLPRSRPGLRQEVREAWQRQRQRKPVRCMHNRPSGDPLPQAPTPELQARDRLPQP